MNKNTNTPTSLQNLFGFTAEEIREFIFESEVAQMEREEHAFEENDAVIFFTKPEEQ